MLGRRSARPTSRDLPVRPVPPGAPVFDSGAEEARRAEAALAFLRRSGGAREDAPGSPVGREWRELQRRRRRRTARRTAAWVTTLVVTLVLAGGGWFGGRQGFAWLRGHTDLFRAKSIEVTGLERLTRQEVVQAAGLTVGQDLMALRPDSVRAALVRLPRVKSVTVDRTLQREIKLVVTERKPAALILLAETWEIDGEGVLLPADGDGHLADLPVLVGLSTDSARAGARLDSPGLKAALLLADRLAQANLLDEVSDINVARADSLVLVLQPDGAMVRAGDGDVPIRRLQALQAARADLALRKIDPAYFDIRFAGMIVARPLDPNAPQEPAEPAPASRGVQAVLAALTPATAVAATSPAAAGPNARSTPSSARLAAPSRLKPKAALPAAGNRKQNVGKPGPPGAGALKKSVQSKVSPPKKTVTGKAGKPAAQKPAQGQRRPHGQHT